MCILCPRMYIKALHKFYLQNPETYKIPTSLECQFANYFVYRWWETAHDPGLVHNLLPKTTKHKYGLGIQNFSE